MSVPQSELISSPSTVRCIEYIRQRGLVTPAILFLESTRPFSGVIGACAAAWGPVFGSFFGGRHWPELARILQSPDELEQMIRELETPVSRGESRGS